jgi:hypothetical protein
VKPLKQDELKKWPKQFTRENQEFVNQYGRDPENVLNMEIVRGMLFPDKPLIIFPDWLLKELTQQQGEGFEEEIEKQFIMEKELDRAIQIRLIIERTNKDEQDLKH